MKIAGHKILIADNDEEVLINFERILENEAYCTTTVVSRAELLKTIAQDEFDLLVLDDCMSDADSMEVMQDFHPATNAPLVVVTYNCHPAEHKLRQLRAMGVSAFVGKCAHSELTDIIRYLLTPRAGLPCNELGGCT